MNRISASCLALSAVFYVSSLILPALHEGNESDFHYGLFLLLFGGLNAVGGTLRTILGTGIWALNFAYFAGWTALRGREPVMAGLVSAVLALGGAFALAALPWVEVLRDEAGNTTPIVVMPGARLWVLSLLLLAAGLSLPLWQRRAPIEASAALPVVGGLAGSFLIVLSIAQLRDARDLSLRASAEFSDRRLVAAISAWQSKRDAAALREGLRGHCDEKGRFGLTPLSYFLLRRDEEAFRICLSETRTGAVIPDKYGLAGDYWRAPVIPSAMEKVWGNAKTSELLQAELYPSLARELGFFRSAPPEGLAIREGVLRASNFPKLFSPGQGPIAYEFLRPHHPAEDWANPVFIDNVSWLVDADPETFRRPNPDRRKTDDSPADVAGELLRTMQGLPDSPELSKLRTKLESVRRR